MSEFVKRVLFGALYVIVLWTATYYSLVSFGILFFILGLICLFEMWMLRKGKSKLVPFIYVLTPFFIVQIFGFTPLKPQGKIGVPTFRLTQDRTILEFSEPVVATGYKPLEFNGKVSGIPAEIKAPFASQKVNFSNSKCSVFLF